MRRQIEITTLSTAAGTTQCDTRSTCPSVHALADRPADYHLIGTPVTDPDELAAFATRMGPGEVLFSQPRPVIDALRRCEHCA